MLIPTDFEDFDCTVRGGCSESFAIIVHLNIMLLQHTSYSCVHHENDQNELERGTRHIERKRYRQDRQIHEHTHTEATLDESQTDAQQEHIDDERRTIISSWPVSIVVA